MYSALVAQTVKRLAYNVGDLDSVPGLGRSPGEGKNNLGKTHTKEEVGH